MPDDPRAFFDAGFAAFLNAERDLIVGGASERSLCARLMLHLEAVKGRFGFGRYVVDVDYNRMRSNRVKHMVGRGGPVQIETDLIVHRRGEPDNLVALEMKKTGVLRRLKDDDRDRLNILTLPRRRARDVIFPMDGPLPPEHVSGYELGLFLIVNKDSPLFRIEEYRDGRQVGGQETVRF